MRRFAIVAALLAVAPAGRAEVIKGYVPGDATSQATHDRFTSGFPGGPVVANSSAAFVAAGLDLSGVGWKTDAPFAAVTLVSDRHIVGAAHVGLGSSVSFAGAGGVVVSRTVVGVTQLTTTYQDSQGVTRTLPSDLLVGRLSAPLTAAADGVSRVAVADPATVAPGLALLVHGQNGNYGANNFYLGRNSLDGVGLASFSPRDANGDPQNEATRVAVYRAGAADGNGYLTGGDSGGPLLARGGPDETTTALVGVHYGVSNNNPGAYPVNPSDISASTYVPDYIGQINQVLAADGFTVLVVPVPEPAGLLAAAAVGAAVIRRLRRP